MNNRLDVLFEKHLTASEIIDRMRHRMKIIDIDEATIKTPVGEEYRRKLKKSIHRIKTVSIPLLEYGHQLVMKEIAKIEKEKSLKP